MHIEVNHKTIVFLCDRSGIGARPWCEAGYDCILVDTEHPPGVSAPRPVPTWPAVTPRTAVAAQVVVPVPIGVSLETAVTAGGTVRTVGVDVRKLRAFIGVPFGVVAWPPCTHLANTGSASWSRKGDTALLEALSIADACQRIARRASWWFVENPVGRLSHYWGPPDHVFDPCDFGGYLTPPGDAYTKRTCLWSGGSFMMPTPRPVPPTEGSLVAQVANVDRRSETPRGFARAVYETMCPDFKASRAGESLRESCRPGQPLQPPADLACPSCGNVFARGRTDQRYCSTRCRVYSHRSRRRGLA